MSKQIVLPLPSFPVVVLSDYDGDTAWIALTFTAPRPFDTQLSIHRKLRLSGINCPELSTPEGLVAKAYAIQWFKDHVGPYRVEYHGDDKYANRIDGRLIAADGHCLNDDLLHSGNAVVMK